MGGDLEASSEFGRGSLFALTLPAPHRESAPHSNGAGGEPTWSAAT
jgi:hypothetical protein